MNRGQLPPSQGTQIPTGYRTQQNYNQLLAYSRKNIAERTGQFTAKTDERLQKVLNHYIKVIPEANPGKTVQDLNRETLKETLTSVDSWLRRGGENASTSADRTRPNNDRSDPTERMFSGLEVQMNALQKERSVGPTQPFPSPNFKDQVEEDDAIDPMVLFERAKQAREKEGLLISAPATAVSSDPPLRSSPAMPRIPDVQVPQSLPQSLPQDMIIRQQDVVKYRETEHNIFINSGDRDWVRNKNENRYNFTVNFNTANNSQGLNYSPSVQDRFRNIVRIEAVKCILSQESVQPVLRRKEITTAYNLKYVSYDLGSIVSATSFPFVSLRIAELNGNSSGTNNKLDNTFAVMQQDTHWGSDPANGIRGYVSMTPKYLKCQKVYAPTPLADLNKLSIRLERPDGQPLAETSDSIEVESITFNDSDINELASVTGGNPITFALYPYVDTSSQFTTKTTRAREIGLETDAAGNIIYMRGTNIAGYNRLRQAREYIAIKTKKNFSRNFISPTERIVISGFKVANSVNTTSTEREEFNAWINRPEGHYIAAIANNGASKIKFYNFTTYGAGGPGTVTIAEGNTTGTVYQPVYIREGTNDDDQANYILIPNRFSGDTTDREWFGGTEARDGFVCGNVETSTQSSCALINTNRQTHLVLRVITRELDGTSNLRPDNT